MQCNSVHVYNPHTSEAPNCTCANRWNGNHRVCRHVPQSIHRGLQHDGWQEPLIVIALVKPSVALEQPAVAGVHVGDFDAPQVPARKQAAAVRADAQLVQLPQEGQARVQERGVVAARKLGALA